MRCKCCRPFSLKGGSFGGGGGLVDGIPAVAGRICWSWGGISSPVLYLVELV